eukprot:3180039-Rhodomonas_salina.1
MAWLAGGYAGYGTLEAGEAAKKSSRSRHMASAVAMTAALSVICVMAMLASETSQTPTVSFVPLSLALARAIFLSFRGPKWGQGCVSNRNSFVPRNRRNRSVLDDSVQDPMQRQLNFGSDEPAYEWSNTNGDEYDAEKQNVFAEPDAFDPPDV